MSRLLAVTLLAVSVLIGGCSGSAAKSAASPVMSIHLDCSHELCPSGMLCIGWGEQLYRTCEILCFYTSDCPKGLVCYNSGASDGPGGVCIPPDSTWLGHWPSDGGP